MSKKKTDETPDVIVETTVEPLPCEEIPQEATPTVQRTVYHLVSGADTLDSIAKQYHADTADIIAANKRQYPGIVLGVVEAGSTIAVIQRGAGAESTAYHS